jgi:type IV secretory pathway VirB2 component (pilin)
MHPTARTAVVDTTTFNRALLLAFIAIALYLAMMPYVLAQATPMGNVLCDVVDFIIYGNLGRGLATLAIIIVGVGATLGKVSWGLAITVAVGISVVFGAYDIGDALGIPAVC